MWEVFLLHTHTHTHTHHTQSILKLMQPINMIIYYWDKRNVGHSRLSKLKSEIYFEKKIFFLSAKISLIVNSAFLRTVQWQKYLTLAKIYFETFRISCKSNKFFNRIEQKSVVENF